MMLPELQVKQFVGVVVGGHGTFNAYETGDRRYYLFRPVANGCEGSLDIPVLKRELKDECRAALRRGLTYVASNARGEAQGVKV